MFATIGIDAGAISVKAACVVPAAQADRLEASVRAGVLRPLALAGKTPYAVFVVAPARTRGRALDATRDMLTRLAAHWPSELPTRLMLTGGASRLAAEILDAPTCNEFQATTRAIDALYPQARTAFAIGGETSRYLRLAPDPSSGRLGILDYSMNGDCAAGTGAFLDQQAARLNYAVEDVGQIVSGAPRAAQIAGRCSVFAKSDMIHAQQKGFAPPEVLRGLCNAVAANFKSAIVRGHDIEPPVLLLGGVSANSAVVAALREVFELDEGQLFVPAAAESLDALGAALLASDAQHASPRPLSAWLDVLAEKLRGNGHAFPSSQRLSLQRVRRLRDQAKAYSFPPDRRVDAYLGLDIGSVGTKLVLVDEAGDVIHSIFTRTEGRPIDVVTRCLREIEEAVGWGVQIRGVGTTGSGRELIGELVGADSINDEITAHKTGATFVGDRLLGKRPDTIFEIGGQDSKYIRLEAEDSRSTQAARDPQAAPPDLPDSVVVDFTMNEACAAGTGSFLEERAAELGVSIKGEFAELALRSAAPIRLGERCTVFMERDVNTYVQRGAQREDIIAGLAYSIAYNYINRVVRGRPVGDCIFFQGGTAYNDAVAAAFSMITGKEIIIPPHNAVLGAIGAALLAREKIRNAGAATRFRGYDLAQVDYRLREFTCRGCGNLCSIQEFDVEGAKTFWGDKCSDRYRKQAKTERKAVIPDLVARRHELLHADDDDNASDSRGTIGIPLAMYTWDWLPLWRRFFRACGYRVVVSEETNRRTVWQGLDSVVSEPCFPIIVAHGHVAELVERDVDYLWVPNIITAADKHDALDSCVCPWGATLPFVVRQAPRFRAWRGRILCPTLSLQRGPKVFRNDMIRVARELGVQRTVAARAFDTAVAAQRRFRSEYEQAGLAALDALLASGAPGMLLVGRPYNMHDAGVSLSVARKLRDQYGVNLIPIDALPLGDVDIADVNDNMYWSYGRKILAAAKLVGKHPNLHVIYITNFKCGPDSFVKGFVRPASGKPFLTLQFDGHSNDAGMMTRCEAYLDSKGVLRWWRACQSKPESELLPGEPSTSPTCPTPARG